MNYMDSHAEGLTNQLLYLDQEQPPAKYMNKTIEVRLPSS